MVRILDAFEKLLRTGSYEEITINDIARESSTGAGSIYARFEGKRSILLAVHARARGRARRYFHALFNPDLRIEESIDQAIERIMRGLFAWHRRHRNVIKTSLLLGDADIYQGISASFQPWNEQLALLLRARDSGVSQILARRAATAILQISIASFQQWVIFSPISPIGADITDEEFIAAMSAAAMGQLHL